MADLIVVDVVEPKTQEQTLDQTNSVNSGAKKNPRKRKRAPPVEILTQQERDSRIAALNEELEGLFRYYKEVLGEKVTTDLDSECGSGNAAIAWLLEERDVSLSKLVREIYEKVKERDEGVTVASVKSSVVFIGQRFLYGVPNADADVLEDETESCLWCWETRDLKLMPKSVRETLKTRRICRKKIHERITTVSGMITALQNSESHQNYRDDLTKASERLHKTSSEADIRALVRNMEQKNSTTVADKQAKRGEKQLIRQVDRDKREAEKERIRLDRERKKEKWQSEKELKRLQDEAEKDERRREKEESELRKQQKRQQEEAEKVRRHREREEAELKKLLSIKKQASLMERFLKKSKNNSTCQNDQSSTLATLPDSSNKDENISQSVTLSMDHALSLTDNANAEDIHKSHLISWRHLGHEIRSNRKQHWGIRRMPKKEAIKELKLSANRGLAHDDELSMEKLVDGWREIIVDGRSCDTDADSSVSPCHWHFRSKKLLQFDKSCRPAFYGVWPKKSQVTGPRQPFRKDPDLDYDVDSDAEWEEEEPGESLSDCDKDDEDEKLEEGYSKDGEDDSEDGFFVPDGYLSDNEGVEVDRKQSDCLMEETKSLPHCKQELKNEEMCVLLRQQKCLHNMTERALRKNQPLIISNLMHESASLPITEELTDTQKFEQMCLQALSMQIFSGGPSIEITIDYYQQEDQENHISNNKDCTTPAATPLAMSDSDLPDVVSSIQSCSQGINKVVESLQQKFPSASKSLLRNKVREVSDFMDNRWQVKKDILDKLGLSSSPDKVGGRGKSIATFFSKRCLPPTNGRTINQTETSLLSSQKPSTVESQPEYTSNAI